MRSVRAIAVALVVVAATVWAKPAVHTFTGKVVGVLDGDTLLVLHDKMPVKVRVVGIDAPETGQAYGTAAKQHASQLVFGKNVTIKYTEEDKYGRILGDVALPGGEPLSKEMVKSGYAWHYRQFSKDRELDRLEAEARQERRGLWQDKSPEPPWEYRKRESKK